MGKYADDPAFSDITPLPTDEGGANPLAAIAYTEEYEETMSYLRAVMAANEHSPRVLDLTADLIDMNPAHYTVWLYRAATLLSIRASLPDGDDDDNDEIKNAPLLQELSWLNQTALSNQKNYQIWHHRTTLVDTLNTYHGEREFMNRMFALDPKNYHVWSYRQWLVKRFNLFPSDDDDDGDEELAFTTRMLQNEIRNNSVWNHRWFIINAPSNPPSPRGIAHSSLIRDREITFVQNAIRRAPQNESAWNYLRAIFHTTKHPLRALTPFVQEFARLDEPQSVRSSHAVEMWSEIYSETSVAQGEQDQNDIAQAGEALDLLAQRFDPLHAGLWEYKKSSLGLVANAAA